MARVKSSRERAEVWRRERGTFVPQPPTADEIAEESSRRALEDSSLQPGDIVSTNRGLFQFQGDANGEHKSEDFVRIR